MRDAYFRAGASLLMWLFAVAAYALRLIEVRHLVGISVSVAYLVLMGFPVVAAARRITGARPYKYFIILISVAEVLGYSGVIFSLGGVEAQYLLPLYVAYVAYMGIVEHRESPYVTAAICGIVYDLMLALQYFGILPSMRAYPGFTLPWENQVVIALAVSGFLFIAAYMSAFASATIKVMRQQLAEQNLQLERRVEERTAALLQEIEERKRAEEKINVSLREKDILLKEIHHRVKNNLQVVSSLLSLQSASISNRETKEIFTETQNRVRSMALVHEKLYQSKVLERINFAEYVRSLMAELFRSSGALPGAITFTVDAEDILLTIDTAIPCGLIINELFSNALKHAFPGRANGEIAVCARAESEQFGDNSREGIPAQRFLDLVIRDNGIGLPAGIDFRKTETLGMQLVSALAQQLDGTIDVEVGPGTTFRMRFPLDTGRGAIPA